MTIVELRLVLSLRTIGATEATSRLTEPSREAVAGEGYRSDAMFRDERLGWRNVLLTQTRTARRERGVVKRRWRGSSSFGVGEIL